MFVSTGFLLTLLTDHVRLRLLVSCENPIRGGGILPTEKLPVNYRLYYSSIQQGKNEWIDRDQLDVLMGKLHTTSDTTQLLNDMREQYHRTIEVSFYAFTRS